MKNFLPKFKEIIKDLSKKALNDKWNNIDIHSKEASYPCPFCDFARIFSINTHRHSCSFCLLKQINIDCDDLIYMSQCLDQKEFIIDILNKLAKNGYLSKSDYSDIDDFLATDGREV